MVGGPGGPATGSGPGGCWTEARTQIFSLLDAKDSDAAELYKTAVESLAGRLTGASVLVGAHCVRELIKVLPVILGYPAIERADASRAARELNRAWLEAGLPRAPEGAPQGEVVSVPRVVYVSVIDVVNAGASGSKNSRELTSLIVTGQSRDPEAPPVQRVHRSIEMFRGLAHARDYTKPAGPLPSQEHLLGELAIIEEALLNRLANMADRAKTVYGLLAVANSKVGEGDQ